MSNIDIFKPSLPSAPNQPLIWGSLHGSAAALAIVGAVKRHDGPVVVVVRDEQQAWWLEQELKFFAADLSYPVLHFPDWETLPYDVFSPHQDIVSRRLKTLHNLPRIRRGLVVMTASALLNRLPPPAWVEASVFNLSLGDTLNVDDLRRNLEAAGYGCVPQVTERGEFAVRGALFDIYPMGAPEAYRIDLFDDEIESIRRFDPDSQRSIDKVDKIELMPAREFPMDAAAIEGFRRRYRERFPGDLSDSQIYREVSEGNAPGGIEYYLPLFFDRAGQFFDYLAANPLLIGFGDIESYIEHDWKELGDRYEQHAVDRERPLLKPAEAFLTPDELEQAFSALPRIAVHRHEQGALPTSAEVINFPTTVPPPLKFQTQAPEPANALKNWLSNRAGRTLLIAESEGRREVLLGLLRDNGIRPSPIKNWREFAQGDSELGLAVANVGEGLVIDDPKLSIVIESQLLGDRARQTRQRRKPARDPASIVKELGDLVIGAPVVHEQYGVGRYRGLQKLDTDGIEGEYLQIEYAEGAQLYVPVASLHLISRYTGSSEETAPLHHMGSGQWEKARKKAAQKARDVAAELLDIHARRAARKGDAMQVDESEYQQFANGFPFDETEDQATAIEQVIGNLRARASMDRVVCGDVGFGKTEVAMRAAFVATQNSKQVAVLVPTTLLAQQHYQNFLDRFADWPVRVEVLSRFRTAGEQKKVLADCAEGKVDIVIGTHRLLQKDVAFKDVGLIIVDEEQRFGVRHKERLKELRAEVDILTLTATPIPRTLNMALSGLRDMSIIATPPESRLAVKTFVSEWKDALLVDAMHREIRRGGQIYFLHNDVQDMDRMRAQLGELMPEARIEIGHGQMPERELEQVMLDFYHRRFDILLCSTIIESGIDVPNANTIIINRADKFGLAQLHQIRGRVGRSHHRAYCYLLTPHQKAMTPDAVKRLEAIESLEDLGAGFTLATHDLEIRGAGELLGDEQSGQIHEIGFALYSSMLERAVKALKAGEPADLSKPLKQGPEVELHLPALIPADYIPDVHQRLILYKRIANAADNDGLRELQVEMIDRFGLLPEQTKGLFEVTRLKLKADALGITRINVSESGGRVVFVEQPPINPMDIIKLIQSDPKTYRFDGKQTLRVSFDAPEPEQRIGRVQELLSRFKLLPDETKRNAA